MWTIDQMINFNTINYNQERLHFTKGLKELVKNKINLKKASPKLEYNLCFLRVYQLFFNFLNITPNHGYSIRIIHYLFLKT
jgi:hypothetical protein